MFSGFWDVFCFVWLLGVVGNLTIWFTVRHEVQRYVNELTAKGYKPHGRRGSKIAVLKMYIKFIIPVFNVLHLIVFLCCFERINEGIYEAIDKKYGVEDND